jgi:hypothetical protein
MASAVGALLGACLDEGSDSHDDTLDPIPLLIQTDLGAPPLFTAFRAEGDDWLQIPFDGTGRFEIEVGGAYELLYVCEDSGHTWTQIIFSMTADAFSRTIGCVPVEGPAPTVTVTGTMQQPGRVQIGDARSSTTGPWSYSMDIPRSSYDLVAHDGDRVVVRRDLVIDGPQTLDPIDLASGVELQKTHMRFTGVLGDERVTTRTLWLTPNGVSSLEFEGDTARELPDSLLTANDLTIAVASADSMYTHRDTLLMSLPDVFFPPRLEGIELADARATWDLLPAGADAWFDVTQGNVAVLTVATARWLVGRHTVKTDVAFEGYRDEWRIDPTTARRRELRVELGDQTTSFGYDILGM